MGFKINSSKPLAVYNLLLKVNLTGNDCVCSEQTRVTTSVAKVAKITTAIDDAYKDGQHSFIKANYFMYICSYVYTYKHMAM